MFETSGDVLKMAGALGISLFVIFLSMTLLYVIFILRDISKILDDVKDVTARVKTSIVSPLKAANYLIERITPYVNQLLDMKKKKKK